MGHFGGQHLGCRGHVSHSGTRHLRHCSKMVHFGGRHHGLHGHVSHFGGRHLGRWSKTGHCEGAHHGCHGHGSHNWSANLGSDLKSGDFCGEPLARSSIRRQTQAAAAVARQETVVSGGQNPARAGHPPFPQVCPRARTLNGASTLVRAAMNNAPTGQMQAQHPRKPGWPQGPVEQQNVLRTVCVTGIVDLRRAFWEPDPAKAYASRQLWRSSACAGEDGSHDNASFYRCSCCAYGVLWWFPGFLAFPPHVHHGPAGRGCAR